MTPRLSLWDSLHARKPLTVGAIADPQAFHSLTPDCDVVEIRLDSLGVDNETLKFASTCPLPLLITARGPLEGGQNDWGIPGRKEAYFKLLPYASAIDIELRDFDQFEDLIAESRKNEIMVVGSYHHFEKTPDLNELTPLLNSRADIHKFALMASSLSCIETQLAIFEALSGKALSVMGMGPLGAAARPLMAKAGSFLNYGYLGATPTAPNQWPAGLLKQALSV
ncbi:type I 3-dehydroquinate dehydratase [Verrucomicrobiaceae bacterium 227]